MLFSFEIWKIHKSRNQEKNENLKPSNGSPLALFVPKILPSRFLVTWQEEQQEEEELPFLGVRMCNFTLGGWLVDWSVGGNHFIYARSQHQKFCT